jgi:hypothetical protein
MSDEEIEEDEWEEVFEKFHDEGRSHITGY